MRWKRSLAGLTLACVLVVPSMAHAAVTGRIIENVGVKTKVGGHSRTTAKLGVKDSTNARRIGGSYRRSVDANYASKVYVYKFGKKSHGKYGLAIYSKKNHKVFTFVIYSTKLVTSRGVRVGTAEASLISEYALRKANTSIYTVYSMGDRNGLTEFYVRGGVVHHIVISRY